MKLVTKKPQALIVFCSDPRFQAAFRDFINDGLDLQEGDYIPVVVPGSVCSLSSTVEQWLPIRKKVLLDNILLLLEPHRGGSIRLILINHQDCKGYAEVAAKLYSKQPPALMRETADLDYVAKDIIKAAAKIGVVCSPELYLAKIKKTREKEKEVEFIKLPFHSEPLHHKRIR